MLTSSVKQISNQYQRLCTSPWNLLCLVLVGMALTWQASPVSAQQLPQANSNAQGISSEEFLRRLAPNSFPTQAQAPAFPHPPRAIATPKIDPSSIEPVSYELPFPEAKPDANVAPAQAGEPIKAMPTHPQTASPFSPPAQPNIFAPPPYASQFNEGMPQPNIESNPQTLPTYAPPPHIDPNWQSNSTVGSGFASHPSPQPTNVTSPSSEPNSFQRWMGWNDQSSNLLVSYEVMSLRRVTDSVQISETSLSDSFDKEVSGRYTVSRLFGSLDRLEFRFTGPFHWSRESNSSGPLDTPSTSSLPGSFTASDSHSQSQQIRLASYELNRRWSADQLSSIYGGLRFIDYRETYQLNALKGISSGQFDMNADNWMAGGQLGMDLVRPLSQRWSVGLASGAGVFGNFASAGYHVQENSALVAQSKDDRLRITALLETNASLRYRITQRVRAFADYEIMYIPALATIADQRVDSVAFPESRVRTSDDLLFYGWAAGLSAEF